MYRDIRNSSKIGAVLRATVLCVGMVSLVSASGSAAAADALTPSQALAHDIYKELLEIDTTTATGDTKAAADAMAARLKAAGFTDADVQVFQPAPRKGNLVARLHGSGKRKPILLVAHLDVVPALREDWSVDPFKLTEQDGYFYARGSLDDKYMAASFVTNLIRYRQEGFKPDRDIIVALETDEEIFDRDGLGIQWLLKNHRDLIDAEFALNEGGGVRHEGRQADTKQRADHRKGRGDLSTRRSRPRRPLLGAAQGQRDLSPRRRPRETVEILFPDAAQRDDARLFRAHCAIRE